MLADKIKTSRLHVPVHNSSLLLVFQYTVESITNKKLVSGKIYYLVKWKGYSQDQSTWEPIENLTQVGH